MTNMVKKLLTKKKLIHILTGQLKVMDKEKSSQL